jgi:hypothetical protein
MKRFFLASAAVIALSSPALASEEACIVKNGGHEKVPSYALQFNGQELVAHVLPDATSKIWTTFKIGSEVSLANVRGKWGFVYGVEEGTHNNASGGYLYTGAGWVELSGLNCHPIE